MRSRENRVVDVGDGEERNLIDQARQDSRFCGTALPSLESCT